MSKEKQSDGGNIPLFGRHEFGETELSEVRSLLEQKLGKEHLANRPGSGGKEFTYVESWRAIDLANSIFGFNGWSSSVVDITPDYIEEAPGRVKVGVTAIVKVTLKDGTFHEDVGYGASENPRKGQAIANAKKEAVTDAMKRALRLFGSALGNCIYDKTHIQQVKTNRVNKSEVLDVKRRKLSHNSSESPTTTSSPSSVSSSPTISSSPSFTPPSSIISSPYNSNSNSNSNNPSPTNATIRKPQPQSISLPQLKRSVESSPSVYNSNSLSSSTSSSGPSLSSSSSSSTSSSPSFSSIGTSLKVSNFSSPSTSPSVNNKSMYNSNSDGFHNESEYDDYHYLLEFDQPTNIKTSSQGYEGRTNGSNGNLDYYSPPITNSESVNQTSFSLKDSK